MLLPIRDHPIAPSCHTMCYRRIAHVSIAHSARECVHRRVVTYLHAARRLTVVFSYHVSLMLISTLAVYPKLQNLGIRFNKLFHGIDMRTKWFRE